MELTLIDKKLLNILQMDFPVVSRPFEEMARSLGLTEAAVLDEVQMLKEQRIIRQISAIYDTRKLGYQSTLVAMKIVPERLDEVARFISQHPGVSHNYGRKHDYNLWFTIALPPYADLRKSVGRLSQKEGVLNTLILPTLKLYKIGVKLDMVGDDSLTAEDAPAATTNRNLENAVITDELIGIIRETQEDVALVSEPFQAMAARLGITEEALFDALEKMKSEGVMRRYAAVLRHQKAGFSENVMAVWIVPEENIDAIAEKMASVRAVSHCYRRPTYPPDWRYNVFTMIHAKSVEECEKVIQTISDKSGITEHSRLYTTREYKKVRLKYFTKELDEWERTNG